MPGRQEGVIVIEYGTIRTGAGWVPTIWINGRQHSTAWYGPYDRDVAERLALQGAKDEAAHYAGDWDIRTSRRGAARKNPVVEEIKVQLDRSGMWFVFRQRWTSRGAFLGQDEIGRFHTKAEAIRAGEAAAR